ncbi:hypothetical protein DMP08_07295 [Paraeggerthella hongkongensis]|uniref:Uncharacterized protein n=1 Tax=Paraeggerthella hongkongensis TaxID=230658 RepID=A0A3N0BAH9_9ACTN|nr:hypothetical protein DMP08_07295 [Paraeggerthella hongkongensis]
MQARACAARLRLAACALAERARLVGHRRVSSPICDQARRRISVACVRFLAIGGVRSHAAPHALNRSRLGELRPMGPVRSAVLDCAANRAFAG